MIFVVSLMLATHVSRSVSSPLSSLKTFYLDEYTGNSSSIQLGMGKESVCVMAGFRKHAPANVSVRLDVHKQYDGIIVFPNMGTEFGEESQECRCEADTLTFSSDVVTTAVRMCEGCVSYLPIFSTGGFRLRGNVTLSYLRRGNDTAPALLLTVTSYHEAENCYGVDVYRCDDGDCIDSTLQCDGIVNCPNGADERVEACRVGGNGMTPYFTLFIVMTVFILATPFTLLLLTSIALCRVGRTRYRTVGPFFMPGVYPGIQNERTNVTPQPQDPPQQTNQQTIQQTSNPSSPKGSDQSMHQSASHPTTDSRLPEKINHTARHPTHLTDGSDSDSVPKQTGTSANTVYRSTSDGAMGGNRQFTREQRKTEYSSVTQGNSLKKL